jgi:RNA polymerase sigma factor (sigma-70 family)
MGHRGHEVDADRHVKSPTSVASDARLDHRGFSLVVLSDGDCARDTASIAVIERDWRRLRHIFVLSILDEDRALESSCTDEMNRWIARLRDGEPEARDQLLDCAFDRLDRLARQMLRDFPRVARWEEASDVRQAALIRLSRALDESPPATLRDFLKLAACQIRRELIDLARHYQGPLGLDRHQSRPIECGEDGSGSPGPGAEPSDSTHEPSRLAAWTELHERIAALSDCDREAFDLLWYQGLTQTDAAAVLGVDKRTVQRRWQTARLRLFEGLSGQVFGE